MPGTFIILHRCTKNNDHMKYGTWDMVGNGQMDKWTGEWTDGHIDGHKKWNIEVGTPPKKNAESFFF